MEEEALCYDFEKAESLLYIFFTHSLWLKKHLYTPGNEKELLAFRSLIKACHDVVLDAAECGSPDFTNLLHVNHYLNHFEFGRQDISKYLLDQVDREFVRFCPLKCQYLVQFFKETPMPADSRAYWLGRLFVSMRGHMQDFQLPELTRMLGQLYISNIDPALVRELQDEAISLFHRNTMVQHWDMLYDFLGMAPDRSSFTRFKGNKLTPAEKFYPLKSENIFLLSDLLSMVHHLGNRGCPVFQEVMQFTQVIVFQNRKIFTRTEVLDYLFKTAYTGMPLVLQEPRVKSEFLKYLMGGFYMNSYYQITQLGFVNLKWFKSLTLLEKSNKLVFDNCIWKYQKNLMGNTFLYAEIKEWTISLQFGPRRFEAVVNRQKSMILE